MRRVQIFAFLALAGIFSAVWHWRFITLWLRPVDPLALKKDVIMKQLEDITIRLAGINKSDTSGNFFFKNALAERWQMTHKGNVSFNQKTCNPFAFTSIDRVADKELLQRGWSKQRDEFTAVLSTAVQLSPSSVCKATTGQRVRGKFHYDMAFAHKTKLAAMNLSCHPRTWLIDNLPNLPCTGPQKSFILKGNGHHGSSVQFPKTYEEMRNLLGIPCNDVGVQGVRRKSTDFQMIQEVIPPLLVDHQGAQLKILARVYYVILRRGTTPSPTEDQWQFKAVTYDLYRYAEPFFITYSTTEMIQDFSVDDVRVSGATLEALLKSPGFVSRILPLADKCTSEAVQAGQYAVGDSARHYIEPDGTFMILAAEFLFNENSQPILVEFTPDPMIRRVLEGNKDVGHIYLRFWTAVVDLLLHVNGLPYSPQRAEPPDAPADMVFVTSREILPHP